MIGAWRPRQFRLPDPYEKQAEAPDFENARARSGLDGAISPYYHREVHRAGMTRDVLEPVGFWSYARHDDSHSDGQLSQLRAIVGKAIGLQYGAEVTLWQDIAAIPYGADWSSTISQTISKTTFFIPVVTPRFLKSQYCLDEFLAFRQRMLALGRNDLVFPVQYVDVKNMPESETIFGEHLTLLRRSQWIDFVPYFFAEPRSAEVRRWAAELATCILQALRKSTTDATETPVWIDPYPPRPSADKVMEAAAASAQESLSRADLLQSDRSEAKADREDTASAKSFEQLEVSGDAMVHQSQIASDDEAEKNFSPQAGSISEERQPDTEALYPDATPWRRPRLSRRALVATFGLVAATSGVALALRSKAKKVLISRPFSVLVDENESNAQYSSIVFSPEGNTLIGVNNFSEINFFDISSKRLIKSINLNNSASCLTFSRDNNTMLFGDIDGELLSFSARSWRRNYTKAVHRSEINSLSCSPDGTFCATGSNDTDVKILEVATGRVSRTLSGHSKPVRLVSYIPNGSLLSASTDGEVRYWDANSGQLQNVLQDMPYVAISIDTKTLAFKKDRQIRILDYNGKLQTTIDDVSGGKDLAVSSFGLVLSSPENGHNNMRLWDIKTASIVSEYAIKGRDAWIMCMVFSKDGQSFVSAHQSGEVDLWMT